ncbi:MAG: hypothetical protein IIB82_03520 [Bacteroidetes bacterium]|nr:hypothetical protein [Bacteroidota bacterium]
MFDYCHYIPKCIIPRTHKIRPNKDFRYFPPARVGQDTALDDIEQLLLQKDWEFQLERIEVFEGKYTDDTASVIYLQHRKAKALIALREYEKTLDALNNIDK